MADNRIINLALDEANRQIIAQVTDLDGVVISPWGSVKLTLGKDPGTTPANPGTNMGMDITFRETVGCDSAGVTKYCIMLRSIWYATAKTSNPET